MVVRLTQVRLYLAWLGTCLQKILIFGQRSVALPSSRTMNHIGIDYLHREGSATCRLPDADGVVVVVCMYV